MTDDYLLAHTLFYEQFNAAWLSLVGGWDPKVQTRFGYDGSKPPRDRWIKVIFADLDGEFEGISPHDIQHSLVTVDCFAPNNSATFDSMETHRLSGIARRALLQVRIGGLFYRQFWKRDFGETLEDFVQTRVSARVEYVPSCVT